MTPLPAAAAASSAMVRGPIADDMAIGLFSGALRKAFAGLLNLYVASSGPSPVVSFRYATPDLEFYRGPLSNR